MKKIIIVIFFLATQICNKLQAQNQSEKKYDSVFIKMKDFISTNLDYERLNSVSCNSSGTRFMILEFKVSKKGKFTDVDIKNDSLKELTQTFADIIGLMEIKVPSRYFAVLKKKQIFIPVLYGNINCKKNFTDTKLQSQGLSFDTIGKIKSSQIEFGRQMQQQFVKVVNSLNNLFSNTGSSRALKNTIIFPCIFIFDNPKTVIYK
jgi:hypothetical protein